MIETREANADAKKRRPLTLKMFLPEKAKIKELTAKPKGTRLTIARIYGYALEAKSRPETDNDGKVTEVTVIYGVFQVDGAQDGSSLQLTRSYAAEIDKSLRKQRIVRVDVTLILESTGNAGSPYQWIVSHDQADAMTLFNPSAKEEK